MKYIQHRQSQSGAVALFVVIFATMLMIIVTLSFVRLMISDQQQATATDLAQSAYDSAQAGVEDAKRVLLILQSCDNGTLPAGPLCSNVRTAVASGACNTVARVFGNPSDQETMIQQDAGDNELRQAYTCVSIDLNTDDYEGQILMNQSKIIPLASLNDFSYVEISWFSDRDVSGGGGGPVITFPSSDTSTPLPRVGTPWGDNTPSLVRAQFMQTGTSFSLSDFDDSQPGNRSNANTLFLYPADSINGGLDAYSYNSDARRSPDNQPPKQVFCETNFSVAKYACRVRLQLPSPISGTTSNGSAFLRLSALYNDTHFKVQLFDSPSATTPEPFNGVQPKVDSTGRANDLFRRVESRVELRSDFVYPEATIDLEGDLCKNFTVTDRDDGYRPSATCAP